MEKNKLKVGGKASHALKRLRGATGLTPNYLCRIGFCLSLKSSAIPKLSEYESEEGGEGREFNRYTLFGQDNHIYMALLRQWAYNLREEIPNLAETAEEFNDLTEAHLNRGTLLLVKRIEEGSLSFSDLVSN